MAICFPVSGSMMYAGQEDRGNRLSCLFPLSPRPAYIMEFYLSRAAGWPCILPLTNRKRTVAFAGYEGLRGAGVLRGSAPKSAEGGFASGSAQGTISLCP